MREAIERVIAELEVRRRIHAADCSFIASAELEHFINKLKEVLANEPLKFGERIRGTEHNLPTEKEGEI